MIYVSPTGSDSTGNGSSSNPYKHIYKAIDQSYDGATIVCKSGTYDEELYRNIGEKNIIIKSETGNYEDVIIVPKTYDNTGTGNRGWLWRLDSNFYTLKLYDLTFLLDYNNIDIANTTFGNSTTGIFASYGNGNVTATRCFVYATPSRWDGTGHYCHFVYEDWDGSNIHNLYKCTVRHLKYGIGVVRNTVNVKDTIFEDNYEGIHYYSGTLNENNNTFYGNGEDIHGSTLDSTDLTSDPLFVATDSAVLYNSSPCNDAGVVISGYVENYEGTAPDIGSYEISIIKSSTFSLSWNIVKLWHGFILDWAIKKINSAYKTLSWVIKKPQRRYNVVTYPVFTGVPSISEYTFSAPITGTLDSLVFDFSNTGTSGDTTIELYLNDNLMESYTKTANNDVLNKVIRLNNESVSYEDKLKIKITSVATDVGTLHIALQTNSFTENLEIIKKCNVFNSTEYEEEYFYGTAEEWRIYLNQPLSSLINVYAKSDDYNYSLSSELNYGDIGRNYIKITPSTTINNYDELVIVGESDIDNKVKSIIIPLKYYTYKADYPDYIYQSFSYNIYLPAIKLYYSWDNINWYSSDINSGKVTINNVPSSKGTYTFYVRYYYDLEGRKVISDTHTIVYNPDPIDIQINTNEIEYNDIVPLDRIEIYADGTLEKQLESDVTISGFDNYTFQSKKTDPTVETGSKIWIYVSPTGSDSNDGSYSKPYKHLYKAIQEMNGEATIVLKSGIYNEENLEGTYPKIQYDCTITSETNNFEDVIIYADGWVTTGYSYEDALLYGEGSLTIKNITIKIGNISDGERPIIYNVSGSKITTLLNLFIDGQNKQSQIYTQNGELRIYKTTFRNIKANHSSRWNGDLLVARYGTGGYYKDCIFDNIEKLCYSTPIEADYNCLYNVTDYGNYSLGSNDITSDPKFTASDSAVLQSTSPCKDAGVVISGYVEDYGDTAPDMGCYELNYTILSSMVVSTEEATNITYNSATINGYLGSLGSESQVKVWLEWGTTNSYGNTTTKEVKNSPTAFSADISGLENNTYYHFRTCVSNIDDTGTVYGNDFVLKTNDFDNTMITLDSGIVFEKTMKYSFAQQNFIISDTPDFYEPMLFYAIGFDDNLKELVIKKIDDYNDPDLAFDDLLYSDFIPLWKFKINSYFPDDDNLTNSGVFQIMEAEKIFYPISLPTLYGKQSTKYRVYDVSGKYNDIEFYNVPSGEDYFYYLIVKDSSGSEIKSGQITQETNLTYEVDSL